MAAVFVAGAVAAADLVLRDGVVHTMDPRRPAALLEPYEDDPGNSGFFTTPPAQTPKGWSVGRPQGKTALVASGPGIQAGRSTLL